MDTEIFIVYISPAGSTRLVAETIGERFRRRHIEPRMLDLGAVHDHSDMLNRLAKAGKRSCLFIGSPVYRDVAVPPVVRFIQALPESRDTVAVPFVTWGHACSGVALWQMGTGLQKKGFKIAGAAKVVAQHSLMWHTKEPAGKGHPDRSDLEKVQLLVTTLDERLESGNLSALAVDTLDYQPPERAREMKQRISAPWMIVPKKVDADKCTQCGTCAQECPVAAIHLDPYPQFGDSCFDCFNCIRLCPEDAIEPKRSLPQIEEHIRKRVRTIDERPLTQIYT